MNGQDENRKLDGLDFDDTDSDQLDLGAVPEQAISQSVLYTLDWTVDSLIQQLKEETIELAPDFQRREAWDKVRKSRYIESILLGLPTPQIILAERSPSKFVVIDGKQRLLTLGRFFGVIQGDFFLTGLEVLTNLDGPNYGTRESVSKAGYLKKMRTYPIRTIILRNAHEDELYLIFQRFNTGSVKLSPQELRSALIKGDAANFINSSSGSMLSLQRILGNTEPDFRMRDAELLIRFLAVRNRIEHYTGNLKRFLDEYLRSITRTWKDAEFEVREQCTRLDDGLSHILSAFPEAGKKWTGERFEPRVNRAILDPIAFYILGDDYELLCSNATRLEDVVKLCCQDQGFLLAVTSTTKTTRALFTRLDVFRQAFLDVTGCTLRETLHYNADSNRIYFESN